MKSWIFNQRDHIHTALLRNLAIIVSYILVHPSQSCTDLVFLPTSLCAELEVFLGRSSEELLSFSSLPSPPPDLLWEDQPWRNFLVEEVDQGHQAYHVEGEGDEEEGGEPDVWLHGGLALAQPLGIHVLYALRDSKQARITCCVPCRPGTRRGC